MRASLFIALGWVGWVSASTPISFDADVRPILSDRCYFCHGPDAEDIQGDLQLHTFEHATSDRDGFGPAIVPGKPEESLMWKRISSKKARYVMPPSSSHIPLNEDELAVIKQWIEEGAAYEGLWSLQPLAEQVEVPEVEPELSAIDRFVRERLVQEGLRAAPEADAETLFRRVHLVLTGLLPSPEDTAAFLADPSGGAYEAVVDRLLGSEAYAEHFAVQWMDLARYADSYGYQRDNPREVWPWRDWVLRALRDNMPYDQFVMEQLAGDLLEDRDDQTRLATAFNRLHTQKNEGGSIPEEFRVEYVADRAQTAATAFMGLTLECSRCHDHKFDPISMKDYYRTFALFNNLDESGMYSYFSKRAVPSPSMPIMNEEERAQQAELMAACDGAEAALAACMTESGAAFDHWYAGWDGTVEVEGAIADFRFEEIASNRFSSVLNPAVGATMSLEYHSLVEGKRGKGILLDGDTEVDFGNLGPFRRHHDFSFGVWLKLAKRYKRGVILHRSKGAIDAVSRGYELFVDEGRLTCALVHFHPGNEIRVRTLEEVPVGSWEQVTVTYDGSAKASGIRLYLNGEPMETEVLKDHLTKEIYYRDPPEWEDKLVKKRAHVKMGARFRDGGLPGTVLDELVFFDRELTPLEVRAHVHPGARAESREEAQTYFLARHSESTRRAMLALREARTAHNVFYDELFHMMIMEEQPERRETFVLLRGLYDQPDAKQPVEPGPPTEIFPFGPEYRRDRLGFAEWLTHPNHPLTARVAVNRMWQQVFGEGIVSTPNDFGSQGALPTHRGLLDYLSRAFVDSGWDMQALIKQMVMSETFKQCSLASAELLERDPDNQLLARGPAQFLSAEMLRDTILQAGGLLAQELGGASVDPYEPTEQAQYRRSLYTFWKRNDPSPEMMLFGAPTRQVCSAKREKTATPLQPLVLMNSPQFVEGSRALAAELLAFSADDAERIDRLFMKLTGRPVEAEELQLLQSLLGEQRDYFRGAPEVANELTQLGAVKHETGDVKELAAWTVIANTVVNLDAFYMQR